MTKGERDTEILVVDVLETEIDRERVGELLCVFDFTELREFVEVCVLDLELRELHVLDVVPVADIVSLGVTVEAAVDVNVAVAVSVAELQVDCVDVTERLPVADNVFDFLVVTDKEGDPDCVLEIRIEAVTVGD